MKSISRIILLIAISLSAITKLDAQETMYIYKDGAVVGEHVLSEVDSVIFYKAVVPEDNTVSDIDGNEYKTVVIGTQTWMAENLKTTTYNDGTSISNVTDNAVWSNVTIGAYCWYENDEATYKEPYGALYNGYSVETEKLCPSGWHVPTYAEWELLYNYLSWEVSGDKLKEVGTIHWKSPNLNANNETGFTALPGGYRYYLDGTYRKLEESGLWWASSTVGTSELWTFSLDYNSSSIDGGSIDKKYGNSIRCLKD